jgi:hypothetical protein
MFLVCYGLKLFKSKLNNYELLWSYSETFIFQNTGVYPKQIFFMKHIINNLTLPYYYLAAIKNIKKRRNDHQI